MNLILGLLTIFILNSPVFTQLFDILNSHLKEKKPSHEGIDDLSKILRNGNVEQPRFVEKKEDDFITRLLSQAKNIIAQKKMNQNQNEPLSSSLSKYLPPDFQGLPGLAKRIKSIVEENNKKNDKVYENITMNSLYAQESDSKNINVQHLKVSNSLSFPSKKFKLKIGNETLDAKELSKALLFNVRVLKKCGKHLEKCTLQTSEIEKELIKKVVPSPPKDKSLRFAEVSNDEDLDEYSSIENQIDKINSEEDSNEVSKQELSSTEVNQNEIDEALDF